MARHLVEGLKLHGIAVPPFYFTGLGASQGEFANTTFSSNVDFIAAASDHLRHFLLRHRKLSRKSATSLAAPP